MAVLTRAAWGAGPHRASLIPLPVRYLVLHHTVTPFWVGVAAARNLQAIARARGFLDYSYSWSTDRQGNEIEGRGWGRQGAHTARYNTIAHAISLIGNLDTHPLPPGMVRGLVRLIRRHARYGPNRITHPHSALASTACPGRYARAQIANVNRAAFISTPPPPSEETDMGFTSKDRGWLRSLFLGRQHKRFGRDPILAHLQNKGFNEAQQRELNLLLLNGIREAVGPDGHAADKLAETINRTLDQRQSMHAPPRDAPESHALERGTSEREV